MTDNHEVPQRVPLTAYEKLFFLVSETFEGDGTAAIVAWVDGLVEPEPLRFALQALQQRHPKLRARVHWARDDSSYYEVLHPAPAIPVEFVDGEADSRSWQEHLRAFQQEPIDIAQGPLLRLRIVGRPSDSASLILISIHHALVDGSSQIRLLHDLLSFYSQAEEAGDVPPVEPRSFVSVARARPTTAWWGRLGQVVRLVRRRKQFGRLGWTALPAAEPGDLPLQLENHVLSTKETLALVRRCRREGASIYGVFLAAALRALRHTLSVPGARFRCRCPIDIRGQVVGPSGPVQREDLGCFIGGYDDIYTVAKDTSFWQLAAKADADLKRHVATDGAILAFNLVRFVRIRPSATPPPRPTLHTSFVGIAELQRTYGKLAVTDLVLAAKSHRVGPSIGMTGVTIHGRLNICVGASGVPVDFWNGFREAVREELRSACNTH